MLQVGIGKFYETKDIYIGFKGKSSVHSYSNG